MPIFFSKLAFSEANVFVSIIQGTFLQSSVPIHEVKPSSPKMDTYDIEAPKEKEASEDFKIDTSPKEAPELVILNTCSPVNSSNGFKEIKSLVRRRMATKLDLLEEEAQDAANKVEALKDRSLAICSKVIDAFNTEGSQDCLDEERVDILIDQQISILSKSFSC